MRFKKRYIPILLFVGIEIFAHSGALSFRMSEQRQREAILAGGQAAPRFETYTSHGQNMHYTFVGNDTLPLVLCIHGSPGSSGDYVDYLADSSFAGLACFASVDRPGFGDSDFGRAVGDLAQQAAMIYPIIERHGQHGVILVGHSLGGPVAARLAMDYPDAIDAMVLIAPSLDPELEPKEWYRVFLKYKLFRWLTPTSMVASNDEIVPHRAELGKMLPLWPRITARATIIQGDADFLVHPGNAAFAAGKLVNSREVDVQMVPKGSHFILWSRKDLVDAALRRHLALLGR